MGHREVTKKTKFAWKYGIYTDIMSTRIHWLDKAFFIYLYWQTEVKIIDGELNFEHRNSENDVSCGKLQQ